MSALTDYWSRGQCPVCGSVKRSCSEHGACTAECLGGPRYMERGRRDAHFRVTEVFPGPAARRSSGEVHVRVSGSACLRMSEFGTTHPATARGIKS